MRTPLALFTVLLLSFSACGDKPPVLDPTIPDEARVEAKKRWNMLCKLCHGENGRGDGPQAAALNPKPRNHSDKAWQKSVTDEHIEATILKGGQAVLGRLSAMPPSPDLESQPNVLKALREMVRNFGR